MAKLGDSWGAEEELLHPRGKDGRFISKAGVGMLTAVAKRIKQLLDRIDFRTFQSDGQASQYLFNDYKDWPEKDKARLLSDLAESNAHLRSGDMDASTKQFVDMMDRQLQPANADLILHRTMGPEAFGIDPAMMDAEDGGVWDLQGKLVQDKGYTTTVIGTPLQGKPIHMAIVAPKGTKVAPVRNGPNDRSVMMDRDAPVRITRVERDGQGGYHVTAIIDHEAGGQEPKTPLAGPERSVMTPEAREARITEPSRLPGPRKLAEQDVREQQRVQEFERRQAAGELQPRPSEVGPTDTGPGGPPPRNEPVVTESVGGGPPSPEAPGVTPEERPEPIRAQDLRDAVREANIESPSAGPRRRAWNGAYLDVATGKKSPVDTLRELESDIDVAKRLQARIKTGEERPDPELDNDIKSLEQLADVIAENQGIPRFKAERAVPPAKRRDGKSTRAYVDSKTKDWRDSILARDKALSDVEGYPRSPVEERVQDYARAIKEQSPIEREAKPKPRPAMANKPPVKGAPTKKAAPAKAAPGPQVAKKAAPTKLGRRSVVDMTPAERESLVNRDRDLSDRFPEYPRNEDEEEIQRLAREIKGGPAPVAKKAARQALAPGEADDIAEEFFRRKPTEEQILERLDGLNLAELKRVARATSVREPVEFHKTTTGLTIQEKKKLSADELRQHIASTIVSDRKQLGIKTPAKAAPEAPSPVKAVKKAAPTKAAKPARDASDLDQMTKAELLAEADARGEPVGKSWTKDRIRDVLLGKTPAPVKRAPAKKAVAKKAAPAKKAVPARKPTPEEQKDWDQQVKSAAKGEKAQEASGLRAYEFTDEPENQLTDSLGKPTQDAFDAYRAHTREINDRGLPIDRPTDSSVVAEHRRLIDEALQHPDAKLKSDVEAWRGFDGRALFGDVGDDESLEGRAWTDPGFTSTSANKDVAVRFAIDNVDAQSVVVRMVAPKGTGMVNMSPVEGEEGEMLFPRGAKFRVVRDHGVRRFRHSDFPGEMKSARYVDVEAVFPGSEAPAPAKAVRDVTDIDQMTKAELLKYTDENNIGGVRPSWTKERLKEHIRQIQGTGGRELQPEPVREPIVDTPAAQKPIQVPDRKDSFLDAWLKRDIPIPETREGESINEIVDDIVQGRITPDEGIRRLETEIDINSTDLIEMDRRLRGDLSPAQREDILARRTNLGRAIRADADTSKFLRDHFKKEPDVTLDEVKVAIADTPEGRTLGEQMRDMTPSDVKDLKQQLKDGGYGDIEGGTGEEVFDNALKLIIKRELADREAKKAAKLAPAPKAPDKPKPNLEGSRYQRLDARALAEGLDLRDERDARMLDEVQQMLDNDADAPGPTNPTPAQVGRYLESWRTGPAGPATSAIYEEHITKSRGRFPGETDADMQRRIDEAEAKTIPARKRDAEWKKLADRLMNTRRQRAQDAVPEVKPRVTRDEKKDIATASELTGIPAEQLEARALAKKKTEAPPKQSAVQVAATLRTVGSRDEARALLQGRTKPELVEILKAQGIPGPRRGSKATKADITTDIVELEGGRIDGNALRNLGPGGKPEPSTLGGGARRRPSDPAPGVGPALEKTTLGRGGTRRPIDIAQGQTLTPEGQRALDALGPDGHPGIRDIADPENKVEAAVKLLQPEPYDFDTYVSFENLRKVVGNQLTKDQFDDAVRRLSRRDGVFITPQNYARSNAATRIPAAVTMGGQEQDQIGIAPPGFEKYTRIIERINEERTMGRHTEAEAIDLLRAEQAKIAGDEDSVGRELIDAEITRLQSPDLGGGIRSPKKVTPSGGAPEIKEDVPLVGDPEGDNSIMHGDSATMELAQAYAKKNRNGTANRLMELRRQISTQRGDDSRDLDGPQKMVDELKRLREAETDDQLRRRLDDAIEELDFPQTPVPDLPEGTPPALRKLLEDLNKIPVARAPKGSRLHGFTQEDDSPVESIAQLIRRVNDDKGQISIGQVEREIEDHLRRYHESIDGAYRMWGLSTRAENDNDLRKQLQEWVKDLRGKAQAPSSGGGDLSTPPRGVTPGRARGTASVGTALPPSIPPRSRVLTKRQLWKIEAQQDLEIARAEMRGIAPNDARGRARVQARIDDAQVRIDQTAPGRGGYNWNSPSWDEPAAYQLSGTPTQRELDEHIDRIVALPPALQAEARQELSRQAQLTPKSLRDLRVVTEEIIAFQHHPNAYAIYQPTFRSVGFNPRWSRSRGDFDASYDISKDIHFHPPGRGGSVNETLAHEYGHHLVYRALRLPRTDQAKLIRAIDDSLDGQGWLIREFRKGRSFQEVVNGFLALYGRERVQPRVSGYSSKNYNELLAEIWAEFSTMRQEARPPAAVIGAVLMELAEKLNIIEA